MDLHLTTLKLAHMGRLPQADKCRAFGAERRPEEEDTGVTRSRSFFLQKHAKNSKIKGTWQSIMERFTGLVAIFAIFCSNFPHVLRFRHPFQGSCVYRFAYQGSADTFCARLHPSLYSIALSRAMIRPPALRGRRVAADTDATLLSPPRRRGSREKRGRPAQRPIL